MTEPRPKKKAQAKRTARPKRKVQAKRKARPKKKAQPTKRGKSKSRLEPPDEIEATDYPLRVGILRKAQPNKRGDRRSAAEFFDELDAAAWCSDVVLPCYSEKDFYKKLSRLIYQEDGSTTEFALWLYRIVVAIQRGELPAEPHPSLRDLHNIRMSDLEAWKKDQGEIETWDHRPEDTMELQIFFEQILGIRAPDGVIQVGEARKKLGMGAKAIEWPKAGGKKGGLARKGMESADSYAFAKEVEARMKSIRSRGLLKSRDAVICELADDRRYGISRSTAYNYIRKHKK